MTAAAQNTPLAAADNERPMLAALGRAMQDGRRPALRLVAADGAELPLPGTVVELLRQVVSALAAGQVVSLVPLHKELTTQEAADLLNMSRPHFIRLLDDGAIPYARMPLGEKRKSSHRRIRFADVMAYKARRDVEREDALDAMAQLGQELGLYSDDDDGGDAGKA